MPSRLPPDVVDDGEVDVDVVLEGVGVKSDVGGNIATSGRQLAKTVWIVWSSANSLSSLWLRARRVAISWRSRKMCSCTSRSSSAHWVSNANCSTFCDRTAIKCAETQKLNSLVDTF